IMGYVTWLGCSIVLDSLILIEYVRIEWSYKFVIESCDLTNNACFTQSFLAVHSKGCLFTTAINIGKVGHTLPAFRMMVFSTDSVPSPNRKYTSLEFFFWLKKP